MNKPKPVTDNRSRQLNPQHDAYWKSRGEPVRPAVPPVPAPTPATPSTPTTPTKK